MAILFAGGPAPAANAVISTAAVSFLRNNIDVIGVLHGYSHLIEFTPGKPLVEGKDYIRITHQTLKRTRNSQGIIIGTARANPGKQVSDPAHLRDPERTAPLQAVYDALCSLGVDALISIGGDDTLKTANKFKMFQETLPPGQPAYPRRPSAQDDRQRLHGHRLHLRLFHGGRVPGLRGPQPAGRCRGQSGLFPRRVHGPQRRLAGLWRGHRRRGQPGDQRRGHHRQVSKPARNRSIPTRAARRSAA